MASCEGGLLWEATGGGQKSGADALQSRKNSHRPAKFNLLIKSGTSGHESVSWARHDGVGTQAEDRMTQHKDGAVRRGSLYEAVPQSRHLQPTWDLHGQLQSSVHHQHMSRDVRRL